MKAIRCLHDAGTDVNAADKNGATPLHRAVRTRCAAAVKGSKPETMKVLSSSVYARRDGKWWSVLYQETPLK